MILRETQSGQELESNEDIRIAVESGGGILVQFIETNDEEADNEKHQGQGGDEEAEDNDDKKDA